MSDEQQVMVNVEYAAMLEQKVKDLQSRLDDAESRVHKLGREACDDEDRYHNALARIDELERRLELYATAGNGADVKLEIGDMDGIGCRNETIKLLDEQRNRLSLRLDFLRGLAAGGELEALADALTDDGQFAAMMAAQEELPSERVVERHDHKCPVNDWCVLDRAHWGECKTLEQHKSE